MSVITKLAEIAEVKARNGANRQSYLRRLVAVANGVFESDTKVWDKLPEEVQEWFNDAVNEIKAKNPITDPDTEEDGEEAAVKKAEANSFVAPTTTRLRVMRKGHNIIRAERIPKPVVLVDTREKEPLPLCSSHPNWIARERSQRLKTGDYSVEGMEDVLGLERKSLADLVACTVTYRERFLASCVRLARLQWKAILVEATFEDIKGGVGRFGIPSDVHPNAICGTLDAIEAKFGIPVIYASRVQGLATERAASWLSKHFTYWWLEQHGHGRVLSDSDGL